MNVEEEIFAKRQCRFNKLAAYGFKKNGDDYYLEVPLKSANFLAKIRISSAGKVSGNVFDLDTGEEYLLLRVESNTGSFSAAVKAELARGGADGAESNVHTDEEERAGAAGS